MSTGLHQRRAPAGDGGYTHPEIEPVEDEDEVELYNPGAGDRSVPAGPAAANARGRPRDRAPPRAEVAALLAALLIVAATRYLFKSTPAASPAQEGLLLPRQLAELDGRGGRRLCLAVMGEVYDVTAGRRHYGKDGGYGFFGARDASRAFITGKFQDDLTDDVADFSQEQFQELVRWRDFYAKHKEYKYVGKVVGRFYNEDGSSTALRMKAEAEAVAAAEEGTTSRGQEGQAAGQGDGSSVPCNVKWSKAEGGWVWCSEGQYPRRVLQADWQGGQPQERCACLPGAEVTSAARLYDGCAPEASQCQTSPAELGSE